VQTVVLANSIRATAYTFGVACEQFVNPFGTVLQLVRTSLGPRLRFTRWTIGGNQQRGGGGLYGLRDFTWASWLRPIERGPTEPINSTVQKLTPD
jgi:hypothetical protein